MSQTQPLSGPTSAPPITPSGATRDHTSEGMTRDCGAPHGITDTHKEQPGADLLEFLNATNERAADESCHVHA